MFFCEFTSFKKYPNFAFFRFADFCASTKTNFTEWKSSFGVAQNVWDWHKLYINFFGLAQKSLGLVEGRGINLFLLLQVNVVEQENEDPVIKVDLKEKREPLELGAVPISCTVSVFF